AVDADVADYGLIVSPTGGVGIRSGWQRLPGGYVPDVTAHRIAVEQLHHFELPAGRADQAGAHHCVPQDLMFDGEVPLVRACRRKVRVESRHLDTRRRRRDADRVLRVDAGDDIGRVAH